MFRLYLIPFICHHVGPQCTYLILLWSCYRLFCYEAAHGFLELEFVGSMYLFLNTYCLWSGDVFLTVESHLWIRIHSEESAIMKSYYMFVILHLKTFFTHHTFYLWSDSVKSLRIIILCSTTGQYARISILSTQIFDNNPMRHSTLNSALIAHLIFTPNINVIFGMTELHY